MPFYKLEEIRDKFSELKDKNKELLTLEQIATLQEMALLETRQKLKYKLAEIQQLVDQELLIFIFLTHMVMCGVLRIVRIIDVLVNSTFWFENFVIEFSGCGMCFLLITNYWKLLSSCLTFNPFSRLLPPIHHLASYLQSTTSPIYLFEKQFQDWRRRSKSESSIW